MKSSWEYYPSISYPYCEESEKVLDAFFLIFISMELALDPHVIFFVKALELSFCETTLLESCQISEFLSWMAKTYL